VTLATAFVVYGAAYWIAPVYVMYAPQDEPALFFTA
jgi:ribose transport system permease protein